MGINHLMSLAHLMADSMSTPFSSWLMAMSRGSVSALPSFLPRLSCWPARKGCGGGDGGWSHKKDKDRELEEEGEGVHSSVTC